MSRQSRQAELRKRMAEARSKLQISASDQADTKPLPASSASSILRKPKYTANSVEAKGGDDADSRGTHALTGLIGGYSVEAKGGDDADSRGTHALTGLIGGYSSSEDEGVEKSVPASPGKKRDAPVSHENQDGKKRAKFSTDVQQGNEKTHDAGSKRKWPEKKVSDEVWDEFNALLEDEPDISGMREDAENDNNALTDPQPKAEGDWPTPAPVKLAVAPSEDSKPKKKKRKKQSKDQPYDNEAVTNVEQASYEARLARVKQKSQKTESAAADESNLQSLDFYDPGLAFQQDDDDNEEGDIATEGVGNEEMAADQNSNESSYTSSNKDNNLASESRVSLAEILRRRRDETRKTSVYSGDDDLQQNEDDLADGRWF
ncbi:hypothetical protein ACHAWO_006391 [Cyclotella atomus]|uniref:Uncharacterized protein n=1 Tax=Cyclotella atomus TaxID=382360 RepID=A0ABD3MV89_9STRA